MITHFDMLDLRLFVQTAETNSVRRGAERLHLSAAAASARIKHLEQSLGTRLLHRTAKGVTLTPPGQAFLHHARLVLQQLENLGLDLQEYTRNIAGHVRIAANPTALAEFLPRVLALFQRAHPDVGIDLREGYSAEIVRAVSGGTAELGIISGHVRSEGLEVIDYADIRLALVVPAGHELAGRKRVAVSETMRYEHVGFHEISPTHSFVDRSVSALHLPLRGRIQAAHLDSLCRLVEANLGIGIVPEPSAHRYAQLMQIKVIALSDPDARFTQRLCARKFSELSGYARQLVELLMEQQPAAPMSLSSRRSRRSA